MNIFIYLRNLFNDIRIYTTSHEQIIFYTTNE
jgi:hypothetical protein